MQPNDANATPCVPHRLAVLVPCLLRRREAAPTEHADDALAEEKKKNFAIVYGICAGAPSGPQRMSSVTREPARDVPEGDEEAQGVARLRL